MEDEKGPTRPFFVDFEEVGLKFALNRANFVGRKVPYTGTFREIRGVRPKIRALDANFGGRKSPYTGLFRRIRGGRPNFAPFKAQNWGRKDAYTASFRGIRGDRPNFGTFKVPKLEPKSDLHGHFSGRKVAYTATFRKLGQFWAKIDSFWRGQSGRLSRFLEKLSQKVSIKY